jgi:hypothetical protein
MVTVRAYADATDLQSLTIRVTLPPEIPWARAFQRCTYDPASHEITAWFETLRHGDATEILFEAQLSPTLEAGDLACAQATLSSATPLSQWVTDDPFTPESLDPTCLVVQQH